MAKKIQLLLLVVTILLASQLNAQFTVSSTPDKTAVSDSIKPKSRLTIGGYGEAVYKYNFYSDNMFRYSHAEKYADAKGHGRVDLPHAVFMIGYDFGKGWTFNAEIEFEHGGTGLLDAIPDDSLREQYRKEYEAGANLNPAMWAGNDWAPTGLYGSTNHPKRFTYACTRGPLQGGPGANAIWNITNVTRGDRRYHYMTNTYARIASQDPQVQSEFYNYFPEYNVTGNPETDIYNYLTSRELPVEMSNDDYVNLMVWHRGLAVPAARNLDNAKVQRGRELFRQIGCASCHRPSWTTGNDRFTDPNGFFTTADQRLPRYPKQKIWPYTDMIQHKLHMQNDIRTGWCRTTPLWGRGLSAICTGASDRLHDCRARNVIEAIMWHGSSQSDARWTVEKFRNLSKEDRDAIVQFINAI